MATLSVVMATYNGERWLPDQLASIAGQTRRPDKLIVSDDRSTDRTPELLQHFAERAPFPVVVLQGPGTGLADNFWHAAAAVDTELVAWSDQDDVWHPDKLRRCERALAEYRCDFVSHAALTVDEELGSPAGRYPPYRRTVRRGSLRGNPWHVPSGFASMFRTELMKRVSWDDRPRSHQTFRTMNHDHAVSLLAFADAPRVELRDLLAKYRQHGDNAAGDPTPRGGEAIGLALQVGANEFERLADIALEQGEWAANASRRPERVRAYFRALGDRCRRRAALYDAAESPLRALRMLAGHAALGDYLPRSTGALGPLALARDAYEAGPRAVLPGL